MFWYNMPVIRRGQIEEKERTERGQATGQGGGGMGDNPKQCIHCSLDSRVYMPRRSADDEASPDGGVERGTKSRRSQCTEELQLQRWFCN